MTCTRCHEMERKAAYAMSCADRHYRAVKAAEESEANAIPRARQELILLQSRAIEERYAVRLRPREQQILRLLLEYPEGLTFRALAIKLGLRSTSTIHAYVQRLVKAGVVETNQATGTRIPTRALDFAIRVLEDQA